MATKKHSPILVIDDDQNILSIVKAILCDADYTVLTANSGKAAIALLEQDAFSLIFLDYMMPVMDGPQCMQYFRQHDLLHGTPVVLFTADGYIAEKTLAMGVQDHIKKPFEIDDLLHMVEKWSGTSLLDASLPEDVQQCDT